MILPKKQLPAEWPEGWDEEINQLADMCESVASDTDWLDGIEDEGLLPVLPETLPDHDAPLVASFWLEHLAEQQQLHDRAVMTECEGPHAGVWRYLESIESEIGRLTQACRASTGLERESNLRQLREAEQDRSALTRSHEFCEALRHRIEFTDSQIARCPNPTPEQQTAARWWGGIRTDWMRLTESLLVESGRSTVDGSGGDTAPTAGPNVEHQKSRGRKPSDAPARLIEILDALASYAEVTEQDFDRERMPGPLGESAEDEGSFHWLCAKINPVFRKAKTTFEKYRTGLCALAPYAKQTDFYRRALPHIAPKFGVAPNDQRMPKQSRKIT